MVLREEFDKSLRDLKLSKTVGIDKIEAELWKEVRDDMLNELFKLISDIYRMTDLLTDFVRSTIIPISKKKKTSNKKMWAILHRIITCFRDTIKYYVQKIKKRI